MHDNWQNNKQKGDKPSRWQENGKSKWNYKIPYYTFVWSVEGSLKERQIWNCIKQNLTFTNITNKNMNWVCDSLLQIIYNHYRNLTHFMLFVI